MHRFYLPPEHCAVNILQPGLREARHAIRVLRFKKGDQAVVLDGAGNEFFCTAETASRHSFTLRVNQKIFVPPPSCSVTLLVAVPKGKLIESLIQKSVELGVQRVVPLLTERVVTRLDDPSARQKRDQWRQVAAEAIKQCGAAWLPAIEAPTTIEKFLARNERFDLQLVGSLQKERRHPREILREFGRENGRAPAKAAVWVGPEGDFTLDELKTIQNSGAQAVSFGPLTLRVETAAAYALSILNYEFNSA